MTSEAFKQIVEELEQKYRELSLKLEPLELALLGEVIALLREAEKNVIRTDYIVKNVIHKGVVFKVGGYKLLIPEKNNE